MANRTFSQFRYSLEKAVVDLYCRVTFGATGAPTLDKANSKGIASISRTSTGLFVITLQDTYQRVLHVGCVFKVASGAPAAPGMYLTADAVGTLSAPTITLQFNAAGTATDPASGEEVKLHIALRNSTAL